MGIPSLNSGSDKAPAGAARTPRGAVSDVGGRAAPASLEPRTNFDGQSPHARQHRVKRLEYPDGSAEMVITRVRPQRRPIVEQYDPETGEILQREKPELTPVEEVQAREKSISRSRTAIRRAVMAMQGDHLLTLTYRRNETDLRRAWRDCTRFVRAMRDELGKFDYVAVAERQKRGAWHFHLAVRGKQDLKLIRSCWERAGGDGNIDVRYRPGMPLHKLASYLAKYIAKSFQLHDGERGSVHRYRRSQGIDPAQFVEVVTCLPWEARQLMNDLFKSGGLIGFAQVDGGEPGEIDHYVWGCTWLDPPPKLGV